MGAPVFAANGIPLGGLRFPASLLSSFSPPSASGRCGQGMAPEVARVGNSGWSGGGLLKAAAGPVCVGGKDVAAGARPHHDGSPARRGGARGLRRH
jgi:hypothetical protein